ncbi:hypothetical protein [Haloarchaeobius sp. HRN-SO-5]|uniref:hypothetical protein n=1 Tax=Haloarchaeobius sp. HRN-SO-5 TaxID=3446118 RepID=UPI003EC0EF6B
MPGRRRVLHAVTTATVTSLAGCSVGGEYHDFEATNRTDSATNVRVAWDGVEERFPVPANGSVSWRDLLPDEERTEVAVEVYDTRRTVDWTGDGPTLYVHVRPGGVDVGTYYDD